jgi:hypothetical protein
MVKGDDASGDFAPIDPEATYGVVSNNFMRAGGDGYSVFEDNGMNAYDYGPGLEQVVADYVAANSPYKPYTDGRITAGKAEMMEEGSRPWKKRPRSRSRCRRPGFRAARCRQDAPMAMPARAMKIREAMDGRRDDGGKKHVIARGDTYWDLAKQYYGDPQMWSKIDEANPGMRARGLESAPNCRFRTDTCCKRIVFGGAGKSRALFSCRCVMTHGAALNLRRPMASFPPKERRHEYQNDNRPPKRQGNRAAAAGPSAGEDPQGRRPAGQSGHARRHRLHVDAALSEGVPDRQARDRMAEGALVPDPLRHRSDEPVRARSARPTRRSGTRSSTRAICAPTRARRPTSSARRWKGHPEIVVDWGMRYGNPSIDSRMTALREQGCDRILVFPLYPQYSAATTATVNDKAFESLMATRFMPAIRTVPAYHDEPVYIEALARSIEEHLATLDFEPEKVIASYHGIPQSYFKRAIPITATARRRRGCSRAARLGKGALITCFQSRFGPGGVAAALYRQDHRKTGEGRREVALRVQSGLRLGLPGNAGGNRRRRRARSSMSTAAENFTHIPCLNDSARRAWP